MRRKKLLNFTSPDLNTLQGVVIDFKTTIFIAKGADPEKAKQRYLEHFDNKFIKLKQ